MVKVGIMVIQQLKQNAKRECDRIQKCYASAMASTLYEGRKELQTGMRKGTLGLAPGKPWLKKTGKGLKISRANVKKPLARLASGIRYKVNKAALIGELGFLGAGWQLRFAEKHTRAYTISFTPTGKAIMARHKIFILKETQIATVPARDPVGAFHVRNRQRLPAILDRKFEKKFRESAP